MYNVPNTLIYINMYTGNDEVFTTKDTLTYYAHIYTHIHQHVDDIVVIGNDEAEISDLKHQLVVELSPCPRL